MRCLAIYAQTCKLRDAQRLVVLRDGRGAADALHVCLELGGDGVDWIGRDIVDPAVCSG